MSYSTASETAEKLCGADGCCVSLASQSRYCQQKGLCTEHLKADAIIRRDLGDQLWRFCQQCGKLEPVEAFDGHKRSCRIQLARRRASSFRLPSTSRSTASPADSSAASNAALRPVRGRVRKAVSHTSLEPLVQRAQLQQQQQQQQLEICSRLASIQQQLEELECHVGNVADQQDVATQLQRLQQQYTLLLQASAATAVSDQPAVTATLALGGYGLSLTGWTAGHLALDSTPAAAAVPLVLTPGATLAGVPVVLQAVGTQSTMMGGQAALLGMPQNLTGGVAFANGLGLAAAPMGSSGTHSQLPGQQQQHMMCHANSSSSSISSEGDSRRHDSSRYQQPQLDFCADATGIRPSPCTSEAETAVMAGTAGQLAVHQAGANGACGAAIGAQQQAHQHKLLLPGDRRASLLTDDIADLQDLLAGWQAESDLPPCSLALLHDSCSDPARSAATTAAGGLPWAPHVRAAPTALLHHGVGAPVGFTGTDVYSAAAAAALDSADRHQQQQQLHQNDFADLLEELLMDVDGQPTPVCLPTH